MAVKKRMNNESPAQWMGQPVLVLLKDGSYYIGTMRGVDTTGLTLSLAQTEKQIPISIINSKDKAQVSGFLSSLFGVPNRAAHSGNMRVNNGNEMRGVFGQMIPHIRIGMNMMRTIMPLMGFFRL